jgi:uncharacterized protein YndB with AHSA1/START domain
MPDSEDLYIERTTDLDLDVDELWTLVSTAEGWRSWLVDEADITIRPDASGTATADEVERTVHIESVVEGHSIGFSWWDRGDRSTQSYVQLDIVDLPDGRSQLHVAERVVGATPTAPIRSSMSCSVAARWEIAVMALWLLTVPSLVMA